MNSMPFRQLKSFFKILIGVQYDTTNEGGTVSLVLSMEKPLLSFGESRGFLPLCGFPFQDARGCTVGLGL